MSLRRVESLDAVNHTELLHAIEVLKSTTETVAKWTVTSVRHSCVSVAYEV